MSAMYIDQSQAAIPSVDAFGTPELLTESQTLTFKQLKVALPGFLFDELFTSPLSSKGKKQAQAQAQQQQLPSRKSQAQAQAFAPSFILNNPQSSYESSRATKRSTFDPRKRTDSVNSDSSSDSMTFASAVAEQAESWSPASSRTITQHPKTTKQSRHNIVRDLPAGLRECFTEWRRERKEAILANDMYKQTSIEKVMWNALNSIKASHPHLSLQDLC
jgi:hypothetical protein